VVEQIYLWNRLLRWCAGLRCGNCGKIWFTHRQAAACRAGHIERAHERDRRRRENGAHFFVEGDM
jgi:hypothetical protein